MQKKRGIKGYIKFYITDINGNKKLVFEDNNAIQAAYANAIVDEMDTTVGKNYKVDNKFTSNANPPTNGEDGIAIKENGGLWYGLIMGSTITSNLNGTAIFSGTFATAGGEVIATANDVLFGHDWATTTFNDLFAKPSGFPGGGITVGAGETLTIEWQIDHSD